MRGHAQLKHKYIPLKLKVNTLLLQKYNICNVRACAIETILHCFGRVWLCWSVFS